MRILKSGNLNLWSKRFIEWWERHLVSTTLSIAAAIVGLQALILFAMGQPLICSCGTIKLWNGIVSGPENSQQLTDWYTYTHVIHGFGFYLLLWLVATRASFGLRFALAVGLEAGWEVIENTPFIIDRYRQLALAQGYFGDSVINSVGDTLAGAFGFMLARMLPVWWTVALAITLELFVGFMIHDNLTLNIIQLIYPNGTISLWQGGE
jgi:hypothetical protein